MQYQNQGERLVRTSLVVVGLTCAANVMLAGCKKEKKPGAETSTSTGPSPAAATAVSAVVSTASETAAQASSQEPANQLQANQAVPSCSSDADWTALELKTLQDGRLELANDTLTKPTFTWAPCSAEKPLCERLVLNENQSLLAVGTNGKTLKLAVAETCGNNTSVTLATPAEPASVVMRGVDMVFESAVIGGERLLLSGYARHASERAKEGYVPREYLVSVRETKTISVEPARNKQKAVPVAAANQLVRVNIGDQPCTTVFWKLGVEQCDFPGTPSNSVALFGSHLIYIGDEQGAPGTKGMAWSTTAGHRELLPKVEWIVTDGVNVAWSTGSELLTAQPRWDLPELKGKVVPGAPGPLPVALGCGRTLTPSTEGWALRNLATGTQWILTEDRFPQSATSVAMNCDWLVSSNGFRTSLTDLGKATPLEGAAADSSGASTGGSAAPFGGASAHAGSTVVAPSTPSAAPVSSPGAAASAGQGALSSP